MTTDVTGNGHTEDAPEGTLICVILDRSGSMAASHESTIQGFNEFLHAQQQQNNGGHALMSLTQFDNHYEVNFVGEPIGNVPDLDTRSYVPRGMTALYDAIGRTVHELETWIRQYAWRERVLVVIITDGQENASLEYTFEAVAALIQQKEKEESWNFAYMGANQDSFAVAGSLNIRADFTANYAATAGGTAANYQRLSNSASAYRRSKLKGAASPRFFDGVEADEANSSRGRLMPKAATAVASAAPSRADVGGAANAATGSDRARRDEPKH